VGDTGCRSSHEAPDTCKSGQPHFKEVAKSISESNPDLVFHVGDYRYLKEGWQYSQQWQFFKTEFFDPGNEMLRNSVFLAGRGNHEQCSHSEIWYGNGWFYLFEANEAAQASSCPPSNVDGTVDGNAVIAPWTFDIAPLANGHGGAGLAHRFVVLDTSADCANFSNGPCSNNNPWPSNGDDATLIEVMTKNFGLAFRKSKGFSGSVWWVGHKPLWDYSGSSSPYNGWTQAMYDMMKNGVNGSLCTANGTCIPSTTVAGHQHYFQRIQFHDKDASGNDIWKAPEQYIVGHGGVHERHVPSPDVCSADFDSLKGTVYSDGKDHGYVLWTRSKATKNDLSGWSNSACFMTGASKASCHPVGGNASGGSTPPPCYP
jgi:hypothetical protein